MRQILIALMLLAPASVAMGCDTFATPAELAMPQILAIRAEPPAVPPGGSAAFHILVADSGGELVPPAVVWEVVPEVPGDPPLGTIEDQNGTVVYTAPELLGQTPSVAAVQATVQLAGESLVALKAVVIGDVPLQNPEITELSIAGQDQRDQTEITLAAEQVASLEVAIEPAADDMSLFAWYCTVGTIETYQSNPTELVVQDEPGSGWLFVVVRDGRGGVAWHKIAITVQ